MKRLGDGAHPFTLTLTAQAPPSVQLVPAKRYYGAPIGTSYDVRCFIGKSSLSSTPASTTPERPLKHRTAGHSPSWNAAAVCSVSIRRSLPAQELR